MIKGLLYFNGLINSLGPCSLLGKWGLLLLFLVPIPVEVVLQSLLILTLVL